MLKRLSKAYLAGVWEVELAMDSAPFSASLASQEAKRERCHRIIGCRPTNSR